MGRKGKKRATTSANRTPTRTPVRTPTNLSTHESPPQSTPLSNTQQPSPPLSPDQHPPQHPEEPTDFLTFSNHTESSPPQADTMMRPLSPSSSTDPHTTTPPRTSRHRSDTTNTALARHTSHAAYGPNPHVLACISCNDICVLTGPRGLVHHSKVAPGTSHSDRFFPVVCSACEDLRGSLWYKIETHRVPSRREQLPGTISTAMLSAWPVYEVVRNKFGAEFDQDRDGPTVVVSRAGDWWREGILTDGGTMFLRWGWQEGVGLRERGRSRKDEFFGMPWTGSR